MRPPTGYTPRKRRKKHYKQTNRYGSAEENTLTISYQCYIMWQLIPWHFMEFAMALHGISWKFHGVHGISQRWFYRGIFHETFRGVPWKSVESSHGKTNGKVV